MIGSQLPLGGALGSLARHGVNLFFAQGSSESTPYATATVNIVGSLVIGLLAGLLATGRCTRRRCATSSSSASSAGLRRFRASCSTR